MDIDIFECFETSMGIIIIFSLPDKVVPRSGMKIQNDNGDIWKVKSISFSEAKGIVKEANDKSYRGYLVEPLNNENVSYGNVKDYFANAQKWKLID